MVDLAILDERVSLGFRGGPTFETVKVGYPSGQEKRLQNRTLARHVYAWTVTHEEALINSIRQFWFDRRGDFKAWLLKDWADFEAVGESLGTGDGVETDFQAKKTYTAGFNPYSRTIEYLKAGTLTVYLDGVPQTLTTHYTVSATGLISFVSPPGGGVVVTADFEFYVPVRFDGDAFSTVLDYPDSSGIRRVDGLSAIEVLP